MKSSFFSLENVEPPKEKSLQGFPGFFWYFRKTHAPRLRGERLRLGHEWSSCAGAGRCTSLSRHRETGVLP
jgi:hypothetical protein